MQRPMERRLPSQARALMRPAAIGMLGSALVALGSDLPGSPYGPHAAGLWPLAAGGPASGWEGPVLPWWAQPANHGTGVPSGRLMVGGAVVVGVVLLFVAWVQVWRRVRSNPGQTAGRLWWLVPAWAAPLLLAAPFASQDVWSYGAQGRVVASGLGSSSVSLALGHSVWVHGVDPQYLTGTTGYGPGALDLSALFVKISGGRPWIAAECWRLTAIGAMVLCAWGVHRIVTSRGGNGTAATVAAVANPGVLVIFVASIHNDALMIGLVVAGVALSLTGRPWLGLALCSLAVAVKAPAALAVLAVAWWAWGRSGRARLAAILAGAAATAVLLAVLGVPAGGGLEWVRGASLGRVNSSFSLTGGLFGIASPRVAEAVQFAGAAAATAAVLVVRQQRRWVDALALGFGLLAVTALHPQPWYVLWALPFLACASFRPLVRDGAVVVLCAMAAWSELPLGTLVWFLGIVALLGLLLEQRRVQVRRATPAPLPATGRP